MSSEDGSSDYQLVLSDGSSGSEAPNNFNVKIEELEEEVDLLNVGDLEATASVDEPTAASEPNQPTVVDPTSNVASKNTFEPDPTVVTIIPYPRR